MSIDMKIFNAEPPKMRFKQSRTTPEMRAMIAGQSVVLTHKAAQALVSVLRYKGRRACRRKVSDSESQVWVVE